MQPTQALLFQECTSSSVEWYAARVRNELLLLLVLHGAIIALPVSILYACLTVQLLLLLLLLLIFLFLVGAVTLVCFQIS
jgi:hypothetical protein